MESRYVLEIDTNQQGDRNPQGFATDPKAGKTPFSSISSLAVAGAALSTGKNLFQWQVNIIGRDSGSADTQQKIQSMMSVASQLVIIGGAMAINPLAGGLAIAATGISYIKQIEQYNYEKKWENYALGEKRFRAGPSFNRSRI